MNVKPYLLALVMLIVSPAWADWTLVSETTEGTKFYTDFSTIRKEGNLRKLWEVTNFSSPRSFSSGVFLSSRTRVEYDCKEERVRNLAFTAHPLLFAEGAILWATESPSNWQYAPPNTPAFEILQRVCRY